MFFHEFLYQGDQNLDKPKMASVKTQDGGTSEFPCAVTKWLSRQSNYRNDYTRYIQSRKLLWTSYQKCLSSLKTQLPVSGDEELFILLERTKF